MFQYFPENYVWSLSVAIALESGARIGEVDEICRPLLDAAKAGDDPGTEAFFAAWCAMADKLVTLADEDLAAGRALSAGAKRVRAALYYFTAERMQRHGMPTREAVYGQALAAFQDGVSQARQACTRIEIPYADAHIAGLFVPAAVGAAGPAPCVVHVNGLDSVKELLYLNGLAQSLARRGVASLLIDQPGTGEALRLHGMTATAQSERWASPVLDWLQANPAIGGATVDPARIALLGVSLGGYFAPRAVAFDPRWAAGVVWGANHDWGEMQRRRQAREGERPVPHYWEHVMWVWGAATQDAFMATAAEVCLDGVLDRIRVPFLVTHGENDRQIPVAFAHRTFDALVNSPKSDLVVFTQREGGVEHSSLDNMANAGDTIADWLAETLGASS